MNSASVFSRFSGAVRQPRPQSAVISRGTGMILPGRPACSQAFSAAMAAEKACEQAGLPGRIIPVPREITADCGLGWRTAPENREKTEALFKSLSLETDGYHICLL